MPCGDEDRDRSHAISSQGMPKVASDLPGAAAKDSALRLHRKRVLPTPTGQSPGSLNCEAVHISDFKLCSL